MSDRYLCKTCGAEITEQVLRERDDEIDVFRLRIRGTAPVSGGAWSVIVMCIEGHEHSYDDSDAVPRET